MTNPSSTDQITTPAAPAAVHDFPRINARFLADSVEIELMGTTHTFTGRGTTPARLQALHFIHQSAVVPVARAVRVHTYDQDGAYARLIVTPEGDYYDEDRGPAGPKGHDSPDSPDGPSGPGEVTSMAASASSDASAQQLGDQHSTDDRTTLGTGSCDTVELAKQTPHAEETHHVDRASQTTGSWFDDFTDTDTAQPQPQPGAEAGPPAETTTTDARSATPIPGNSTSPHRLSPTPPPASSTGEGVAQQDRPLARANRESFIRGGRAIGPATQGWRGGLNRLGLHLAPGTKEAEFRSDVAEVTRHWPGPRTVAIANPKGSANKTPATVMLSAVFARYGGAGVLAWDNNETRGSLAWRTQHATHASTVLDLLPRVDDLLATTAQSAEMSHFTHHQAGDKFDVLHSDQSVEGDHEVSSHDVDRVHQVATRYYRLVLMDSGNNERADNWRAMMQRAHALVVPCTNVEDTPEAGALMLDALASRDPHSEELANNAVAIVSQRTPGKDANMARIVAGLRPLVGTVVTIPFDPALVSGTISFDALRPGTQRAWLRAAAAVARTL